MKLKKRHKLIIIIIVVALIFSSILFSGGVVMSYAATSKKYNFEKTNILDDLQTATINGEKFNILKYLPDSTGVFKHPEILTVVEFAYSYDIEKSDYYGLYIYFYNPQKLNIDTLSSGNKVSMGIKYSTDDNGNVKVEDYEKFALKFCSKSTGDYQDLFYKFKVVDHESADGLTIKQRVQRDSRRYDFSEVELVTTGDKNATAYGIGGTYIFEGFAKGFGEDENAESTLSCKRNDIETITLDLAGKTDGVDKRTYWRSTSSSLGAHHQNQINSVFFAIDTDILEKYGYTLQKMKAEWWEYKTAPVVVAVSKIYDELVKYKGCYDYSYLAKNCDMMLWSGTYKTDSKLSYDTKYVSYGWNIPSKSGGIKKYYANIDYNGTGLPFLIPATAEKLEDFTLSSQDLEKYITEYKDSYQFGHLIFNNHDFSADLFTVRSSESNSAGTSFKNQKFIADDGRTAGYNAKEFDITNPNDFWQINSYDSTHNWWDKFLDYGFGKIITDDNYNDISPIQMVKDEDLAVSNIVNHLLINEEDVDDFKKFYKDSTADKNKDGKRDKEVFIFRYAQTDYYAEDLSWIKREGFDNDFHFPMDEVEVRQGTIFFDFDILTMSFNKEGEIVTLGCVSSPIDHFSDFTPSVEAEGVDWMKILKLIIGILVFMLLIVLLYPILIPLVSMLFKGVLWIICLPFKAIGLLIKSINNNSANKRKVKEFDKGSIYKTTDGYLSNNTANRKTRRVVVVDQRPVDGAVAVSKIYKKRDKDEKNCIKDLVLKPEEHSSLTEDSIVGKRVIFGVKDNETKKPIYKGDMEDTGDKLTRDEFKKVKKGVGGDSKQNKQTLKKTTKKWKNRFKK